MHSSAGFGGGVASTAERGQSPKREDICDGKKGERKMLDLFLQSEALKHNANPNLESKNQQSPGKLWRSSSDAVPLGTVPGCVPSSAPS